MSYKVGDLVKLKVRVRDRKGNTYRVSVNNDSVWVDENNIEGYLYDSKTYEDGLNDAWELARKVNAMSEDEFDKCFNFDWQCTTDFTYQEILAMVEAYEKSKQIQVGDVVYEFDKEEYGYGVVTDLCDDECCILWDEGYCNKMEIENLVKTGRHIDISSILKQTRGGNE